MILMRTRPNREDGAIALRKRGRVACKAAYFGLDEIPGEEPEGHKLIDVKYRWCECRSPRLAGPLAIPG
eukprot:2329321-Amphidinium_carterae.1